MKYIFFIFILLSNHVTAQTIDPAIVTSQSISIPGSLAVGNWKNEHPNQAYDYPKMYYGFAEGDEIILDFATENKKGTQIIRVSEAESNSVIYSNNQFQTLEGIRIKVPKASVYKFEFATNHFFDRQCKVTIKRVAASEATRNFNCNVTWKIVNDTTFTTVTEKRKVNTSYEAVTLQSPINYFLNSGRNSMFQGGKSRITFPITLPENTVEWYYTFAATRNDNEVERTKSGMKLFSELSRAIDKTGILAIGINALTQPPGANYCDVYLLSQNNFQSFLNKDDGNWQYWPEASRENLMSGIVSVKNSCTKGTYFIGLKNPDSGYGLHVMIEIVAIVEKGTYETVEAKRPISVSTKKVPVFGN